MLLHPTCLLLLPTKRRHALDVGSGLRMKLQVTANLFMEMYTNVGLQ